MRYKMSLIAILLVSILAATPTLARTKTEPTKGANRADQVCYIVLHNSQARVKVRDYSSNKAAVVTTLGHRARVTVVHSYNGWHQITFRQGRKEIIGWVREDYVLC